jgi:WD40 repeat protein
VNCLAFSPDGRYLATGCEDNVILVWDVATGKPASVLPGHEHARSLSFSPDGDRLAADSALQGFRLWEWSSGRRLAKRDGWSVVVHSPDGKLLVTWENEPDSLKIRDGRKMTPQHRVTSRVNRLGCCATFSPDGKQIAAGFGDRMYFWDVGRWKESRSLTFNRGEESIGYGSDGGTLVVAGAGMVWVFHAKSLTLLWRFKVSGGDGGEWLTVSPDGRTVVASLMKGGVVQCWEVASGKVRRSFSSGLDSDRAPFIAFSLDGRQGATAGYAGALVWDLVGLLPGERPAGKLTPEKLQSLWRDLGDPDAPRSFLAHRILLSAPAESLSWLRQHLTPQRDIDQRRLARLIKDLDGDSFAARQKAEEEIGRLGEMAEPALRKALAGKPPLEQHRRIERLLGKSFGSPRPLLALRAMELLEQMGTPEARRFLQNLAKGAPQAWLTREAKVSLTRLERRLKARR